MAPPSVEKQKQHIEGLVEGLNLRAVWKAANGEGHYSGFSEAAKDYAKERMDDAIPGAMEKVLEGDYHENLGHLDAHLMELYRAARLTV